MNSYLSTIIKKNNKICYEVEIEDEDKGIISQVISNLLSNAIKFGAQGTILISVEKDRSRVITIKQLSLV